MAHGPLAFYLILRVFEHKQEDVKLAQRRYVSLFQSENDVHIVKWKIFQGMHYLE